MTKRFNRPVFVDALTEPSLAFSPITAYLAFRTWLKESRSSELTYDEAILMFFRTQYPDPEGKLTAEEIRRLAANIYMDQILNVFKEDIRMREIDAFEEKFLDLAAMPPDEAMRLACETLTKDFS